MVKMREEGANTDFLGLLEEMEDGETAIMLTLAKKGIGPADV